MTASRPPCRTIPGHDRFPGDSCLGRDRVRHRPCGRHRRRPFRRGLRRLRPGHAVRERPTLHPRRRQLPGARLRQRRGHAPLRLAAPRARTCYDAAGRSYIDYVGSWGPMLLGHAHPEVIAAVQVAAENGLSFGAHRRGLETEMAERICALVPSIETVRMCSSGTEATMSAHARGARVHRPRRHPEVRGLLPRPFGPPARQGRLRGAHDGRAELARAFRPTPPSTPSPCPSTTRTAVRALFAERGDTLACVIVEPICRQHELRGAGAGLPRGAPGALHRARHGADLRRGDDRLPRRRAAARRSATA